MKNNASSKVFQILIVDDNPKSIQTIGSILMLENYFLSYSTSAKDALKLIETNSFDLILLDIVMPDISGFELCEQIKSNPAKSNIPIIFISAKTQQDSIIRGFKAGAQDYIIKPFNSREVIARVKTHLDLKWRTEQLNELTELLEDKVKERTFELQKANEQLEQANQLLSGLETAKTNFLSLISHELRTPLNAIKGFLEILKESIDTNQKVYADYISEATDKLISFSDASLLITQLTSDNLEVEMSSFNLSQIVSLFFNNIQNISDLKEVSVAKNIEPNIHLKGNVQLIEYAIKIIVDNALKYSRDKSVLELDVYSQDDDIFLIIRDFGKGFSKEILKNQFTFFNSDNVMHHTEGFGLGLATLHLIISIHSGSVRISNHDEKGAIVEITLKKDL